MIKKKYIFLLMVIILTADVRPAYGMVPYETYSYDLFGTYFISPDAFVPEKVIDAESLGLKGERFSVPSDIVTDEEGNVYLADTGNSRIIILNQKYELVQVIDGFINSSGEEESFNQPAGVFVTPEGLLYIADSKNYRIVVLDTEGNFKWIITAPSSEILPETFIYEPSALAVDPAGRIYVISKSTNMGVIALSADGDFEGFIGAEKVSQKLTEFFWKLITTREQKQRSAKNVPTEYNNITIDGRGFIYVTTSALDAEKQYYAMLNNDGTSNNMPIKKLNPAGVDVLRRNGSIAPGGDVQARGKVSRFIDVALGDDGVYSVLDSTRNRIFTYDINGNLLYAFGGYGTQEGVYRNPASICYNGSDLLVLDSSTGSITVLKRTHYGDSIALALKLQSQRKYTEAAEQWKYVLTLNSSFDQAYSGVAFSYMRLEMYKEAKDYYKMANDIDGYDKAYREYRKELIAKYFLLIPITLIAVILLLTKCTAYIKKVNGQGWRKKGKRSLKEELFYAYYTMFHPFDGFYDLKHEKRGGIRGAVVILVLVLFHALLKQIATGYLYRGTEWYQVSIREALLTYGLPFILWVVSNWALTTLMNGKGTMKDIFTTTAYALLPMVLLGIPATLFTNIITTSEMQFITFLNTLGMGWSLFLVFFGVLVTNQYSLLKNAATTVCSIAGMGFIAFLGILSMNVIQNMWDFGASIVNEISFRI